MLSSGFSAPGFSLCTHQDSQLLALLIMHSSGFSAGLLGAEGNHPNTGLGKAQTERQPIKQAPSGPSKRLRHTSCAGKKAKGVRLGLPCERQCIHEHTHNRGSTIKLQSEQSNLGDNMLSTRAVDITSKHPNGCPHKRGLNHTSKRLALRMVMELNFLCGARYG
jgi:hypothetical protein